LEKKKRGGKRRVGSPESSDRMAWHGSVLHDRKKKQVGKKRSREKRKGPETN